MSEEYRFVDLAAESSQDFSVAVEVVRDRIVNVTRLPEDTTSNCPRSDCQATTNFSQALEQPRRCVCDRVIDLAGIPASASLKACTSKPCFAVHATGTAIRQQLLDLDHLDTPLTSTMLESVRSSWSEQHSRRNNVLGDRACKFSANSPVLRCAVNPEGPCEGCQHFEENS